MFKRIVLLLTTTVLLGAYIYFFRLHNNILINTAQCTDDQGCVLFNLKQSKEAQCPPCPTDYADEGWVCLSGSEYANKRQELALDFVKCEECTRTKNKNTACICDGGRCRKSIPNF